MLICRTLGPVDLTLDGAPAPPELLWRKNVALLVYVARSPKRTRTREHLVGLLWGDKPEAAARHSLSEALRVLRKYLGEDAVAGESDQLHLSSDAVQLDVDRLEALLDSKEYEAAAMTISGEFMEGFVVPGCPEFEEWVERERRAWRERSVQALAADAERLIDTGHSRQASTQAQRALALDPTSELAVRVAVRSCALAGDRAGALSLYEAFTTRLGEALGIEPDESTQAIAERVRRQRAWKLSEETARLGDSGGESRRPPLVGREEQLSRLVDAWSSCRRQPRTTLALVDGDSGVGKSRLAEEVAARARLDGAFVAELRAVEADTDDAWSGVLGLAGGALSEAPRAQSISEAARASFAVHLPIWRERLQERPGANEPATLRRAFTELLAAVSGAGPLLLAIDDAQWLDRESLHALGAAIRDLPSAPLLVLVCSTQHEPRAELDQLRAHIGREIEGLTVRLQPLAPSAIKRLARWAFPGYDEVELDRLTRRVMTDSAGYPFLVVELLHAVAVGLDLGHVGGTWPEPARTLDDTLPGELPNAVSAAIRVSFGRLSRNAQSVLAAAAVLGDRVDIETLRRATQMEVGSLASALDELEWKRWLTAEPRGYSFVARLVKAIIFVELLTPGQRRRIEEAAGT